MPRVERSPLMGPFMAVPRGVVTPSDSAGRAVSGRLASMAPPRGERRPPRPVAPPPSSRAESEPPPLAGGASGSSPERARAKLGIFNDVSPGIAVGPAGAAGSETPPSPSPSAAGAESKDRTRPKPGMGGMAGAP